MYFHQEVIEPALLFVRVGERAMAKRRRRSLVLFFEDYTINVSQKGKLPYKITPQYLLLEPLIS